MNCCENKTMKGGKMVEIKTKTLLWIVIGILFLATIYLTFKASGPSAALSSAQSGAVAAKSAASYGGMVGGC